MLSVPVFNLVLILNVKIHFRNLFLFFMPTFSAICSFGHMLYPELRSTQPSTPMVQQNESQLWD